jgi:hypothetical protein
MRAPNVRTAPGRRGRLGDFEGGRDNRILALAIPFANLRIVFIVYEYAAPGAIVDAYLVVCAVSNQTADERRFRHLFETSSA